jgi:hypothetical protein
VISVSGWQTSQTLLSEEFAQAHPIISYDISLALDDRFEVMVYIS